MANFFSTNLVGEVGDKYLVWWVGRYASIGTQHHLVPWWKPRAVAAREEAAPHKDPITLSSPLTTVALHSYTLFPTTFSLLDWGIN